MHCRKVAFDPTLDPVRVDKVPVSGVLYNTGQSLVFRADSDRLSRMPVNMTGGPFSYRQAWNGQKRISRKTSVRTRRQKSQHHGLLLSTERGERNLPLPRLGKTRRRVIAPKDGIRGTTNDR